MIKNKKSIINRKFNSLVVRKKTEKKFTYKIEKTKFDTLEKNELIIKVSYSSINYKDYLVCHGKYWDCRRYPLIPGIDAAGTIVFSQNKKFKNGDKVIVMARITGTKKPGGFSEYIKVPYNWAEKIPKTMTLKKAMIFGTAGFTAMAAIDRLLKKPYKKEKNILVSGSTGGVGLFSLYILSQLGYKVTASTTKSSKKNFLKKMGANIVLSHKEFTDVDGLSLQKIKYSGIIDSVGEKLISTASRQLINKGKIISVGMMSNPYCNLNLTPFILRGIELIGLHVESFTNLERQKIWKKIELFSKNRNFTKIYKLIKFKNISSVLKKFSSKKRIGRFVIKI